MNDVCWICLEPYDPIVRDFGTIDIESFHIGEVDICEECEKYVYSGDVIPDQKTFILVEEFDANNKSIWRKWFESQKSAQQYFQDHKIQERDHLVFGYYDQDEIWPITLKPITELDLNLWQLQKVQNSLPFEDRYEYADLMDPKWVIGDNIEHLRGAKFSVSTRVIEVRASAIKKKADYWQNLFIQTKEWLNN